MAEVELKVGNIYKDYQGNLIKLVSFDIYNIPYLKYISSGEWYLGTVDNLKFIK